MYDSNKLVVALKYGGVATGVDAISVSNRDNARISVTTSTSSFKEANGKLGNKVIINNSDDTVGELPIEGYLMGNDATGLALDETPIWDNVYKMCGLSSTTVADESITYAPSQAAPLNTSTAIVWVDGKKRTLTGVIGTLTISGTIGEPIKQSANISGFTSASPSTEANPTVDGIDKSLILVLKSIDTITIGGTAIKAQSFTLTQGNDIQKNYLIGLKSYERSDFDSTLELTYVKDNDDIFTAFESSTAQTVIIKAGSVNGKKIEIKATNAVVDGAPKETTLNGKEAITVKFSLQGDVSGENQFSIKFGTVA